MVAGICFSGVPPNPFRILNFKCSSSIDRFLNVPARIQVPNSSSYSWNFENKEQSVFFFGRIGGVPNGVS